jgi:DNA helicase-2/ATP-dependent DNA helicase PcrA
MPPTTEQLDIINYHGNLLVTAVPGSGKTKTIIDKVERLVEEGLDQLVIVITYTYRAADEVSERLDKRRLNREYVWSGTIHRFCLEFFINPNQNLIPELSRGYEIIDEDDVDLIIQICAEKLGVRIDRNNSPNLSMNIDGSFIEKRTEYIELVKDVYEYFKTNKLINFDMILYYAYKIINEYEYVARNIAMACNWLIVDEYQDTKELQYQIISKISVKNPSLNLMFVGDPNQAIYTTLGGVVKDKNQLEVINERIFIEKHLTGCFRSDQRIIDFYSAFACQKEKIESNSIKYEKPMVCYKRNMDLDDGFATLTKDYISEFYSEGIPYNDICVALPWGIQLMNLASWFLKNAPEIPIDAPIITPLKKMDDGVWNNLIRLLFVKVDYNNIYYYEKLIRQSLSDLANRFGVDCLDRKNDLMDYYIGCNFSDDETATDIILEKSRQIFENIIGLSTNIYVPRISYLVDATKKKIRRYSSQLSDDVKCFKQCYKSKSGVVFSTFHGCKGEEYRAVIVGCLNEGYIPHFSRVDYREDSMKLLYVVMSRAKEKLIISAISPQGWRNHVNKEICECNFDFDD